MTGPIERFLASDHRRLEDLLDRATANASKIDLPTYALFREGLLRHIAMEEKVLLPAVRSARGGEPLPVAATLRLHHGAIAALMVPAPTPTIVAVLRSVLAAHNPLEEGPQGIYAACDREIEDPAGVCARLKNVPPVKVSPFNDDPRVVPAAIAALERAGLTDQAQHLRERRPA